MAPCPLRAAPKGFGKQWQASGVRRIPDPVASACCEPWGLKNAQNLSEPECLHRQKGQEGSVSGSVSCVGSASYMLEESGSSRSHWASDFPFAPGEPYAYPWAQG